MLHKHNCEQCDAEFESSCCTFLWRDGKMMNAFDVVEYRRQYQSGLCNTCYGKLKDNPTFELFFKLKEKEHFLYPLTEDLRRIFIATLEKTPEKLKSLAEQEKANKELRKEFGFEE